MLAPGGKVGGAATLASHFLFPIPRLLPHTMLTRAKHGKGAACPGLPRQLFKERNHQPHPPPAFPWPTGSPRNLLPPLISSNAQPTLSTIDQGGARNIQGSLCRSQVSRPGRVGQALTEIRGEKWFLGSPVVVHKGRRRAVGSGSL